MTKPRVLYDATLAGNPAGTGTYVQGLLAALQRRDDLDVFTATLESHSVQTVDTRQKTAPARLMNSLRHLAYYLDGLPREARKQGVDVIFCPSTLVPLRGGRPFIATVYDLAMLAFPRTMDRLSRGYAMAMLRRGLHRASAICAISNAVRAELLERFPWIPSSRVHVTYPGPNPALLAADAARPPIPERPFVLMVGTVEPRKNHLTMFQALAEHLQHHPGSELTLVAAGSAGWRYGPVLRAISELGLEERVVRLGAINPAALKWLYQHALALMFPSLYEGFGLPVLEAFCLRCPVVASAIPSVMEITGQTDLLLQPTDIAAWAAALDALADGRPGGIAAAPERIGRFTWEACAQSAVGAIHAALNLSI